MSEVPLYNMKEGVYALQLATSRAAARSRPECTAHDPLAVLNLRTTSSQKCAAVPRRARI